MNESTLRKLQAITTDDPGATDTEEVALCIYTCAITCPASGPLKG